MTAILAFLKLAWPYLIALGVGAYGAHELDQIPYGRLQTTLASERAQRADEIAAGQKAAADALQAQINTRLTTEANNGQILSQLTQERDSAASDRDFARRLLAAAQAKPATSGGPVPAAGHQPAAADTALAPGNRPAPDLARLVADSAAECRDAIQSYAGLQLQLIPQLKVTP